MKKKKTPEIDQRELAASMAANPLILDECKRLLETIREYGEDGCTLGELVTHPDWWEMGSKYVLMLAEALAHVDIVAGWAGHTGQSRLGRRVVACHDLDFEMSLDPFSGRLMAIPILQRVPSGEK